MYYIKYFNCVRFYVNILTCVYERIYMCICQFMYCRYHRAYAQLYKCQQWIQIKQTYLNINRWTAKTSNAIALTGFGKAINSCKTCDAWRIRNIFIDTKEHIQDCRKRRNTVGKVITDKRKKSNQTN